MKPIFLGIIFCFLNTQAFAGVDSSGGGPSVVKFSADGQVAHAMLLDVYEGRIRYGLDIQETETPVVDLLTAAVAKMKSRNLFIGMDLESALNKIEQSWTYLPSGVVMAPGVDIGDSHAAVMPTGYQLLYAGYYESNGSLKISQDIYLKMNNIDQAGLKIHEALYKMARWFSETKDSSMTRNLTALLLSTTSMDGVSDDLLRKFTWRYLNPDQNQNFAAQPVVLNETGENFYVYIEKLNEKSWVNLMVDCVDGLPQPYPRVLEYTNYTPYSAQFSPISPRTGEKCWAFNFYYGLTNTKINFGYGTHSLLEIDSTSGQKQQPVYWQN